LAWLPEVGRIRSAIIPNFIEPIDAPTTPGSMGDLVTVGSLENTKNNNFLLEVLAEAKRAGRSLRLDIFGSGALRKDLQRSAESLGIIDQVTFRGYQPDVRQFLRGYRVYVHACPSETGPLAIIEAMAEGLPIVAPKSGGAPELYRDGVEGRFWSLADPAQAAATLIELLDCEAERLEFAAAAVTRFRDNFSAELVGPRLLSFLLGEATSPAEDEPSKVDPAFAR
jgi:glycosyltransferase involved in cell wall biosynthesis